jgi:hypothetical protein
LGNAIGNLAWGRFIGHRQIVCNISSATALDSHPQSLDEDYAARKVVTYNAITGEEFVWDCSTRWRRFSATPVGLAFPESSDCLQNRTRASWLACCHLADGFVPGRMPKSQ